MKPAPKTAIASDWAAFLGPSADSISREVGIIAPWPKEGLRTVFTAEVGNGYVAPAISKGRLFLFDRGADKLRLRCLKSTTGEPIWNFEYASDYEDFYGYDNGPRATPIVDGDRVYISGPEGMLHCLGTEKGNVIWKVDTKAKFGVVQNFFGVGSSPVIEENLLLVQVGGSPADSPATGTGMAKPNGSAVVAFDKLTGEVKYQTGDDLASYAGPVVATINGRRWGFMFARGGLLAFEPATGKIDFRYPWRARILESVNASNPVVVGDRVFISECYGVGSTLLQVKPGGHEIVWSDADKGRQKSMMCHWMTPIYHNGYLYGSSGRHLPEAELRCIELATGKVTWAEKDLTRTSLLMVDGHFLCLGEYGELRLLKVNPTKYEEVSHMVVRKSSGLSKALQAHPYWAAPVLSHGLLYIRGEDQLVCLELIPQTK
ncbi:hypothetical protein AYO44_02415 [Planctomycetaceae bacterium SCGC AG-212-F19]|nr:hypothetical protein AYO44_02415 [Planctomycetaceae bacterium SCGC AG-212-F19]